MVAPFAMVAGGTISATQIYKPQNIIAWGKFGARIPHPAPLPIQTASSTVLLTVGPGILSLVNESSPKHAWIPLYASPIATATDNPLTEAFLTQAHSLRDRRGASLRRDGVPRARPARPVPSRTSARLPRLCAQFREYPGYHHRCVRPSFFPYQSNSYGNYLCGMLGSTVLTNELGKKLPAAFLALVPGGVSGAYSAIPLIAKLSVSLCAPAML